MWPVFERLFGRKPTGDGWDVRIERKGRGGPVIYLEGPNRRAVQPADANPHGRAWRCRDAGPATCLHQELVGVHEMDRLVDSERG